MRELSFNINEGVLATAKAAAAQAGGVKGIVRNPIEQPQQLVLTGTTTDSKTNLFIDDSMGLAGQLGLVGTTNGTAMTANTITAAILKTFLLTHALVIGGYNFETTSAPTLSNNLNVIYSTLDGNSNTIQLFSAKSVSNMQQNPLLLNVVQPFVYTFNAALKITIPTNQAVAGCQYTFTFDIIAAIPYGNLDMFLDAAKIPARSKMTNGC